MTHKNTIIPLLNYLKLEVYLLKQEPKTSQTWFSDTGANFFDDEIE
jgi:hypothetical protein